MKVKVAFLTTIGADKAPQIGDGIVITFDEKFTDGKRKACIVIDGGDKHAEIALKNYLQTEKIQIIDLIIATHIDNDHIAGLNAFLSGFVKEKKEFELRNYWGPAPESYSESLSITKFISYTPDVNNLGIEDLSFIAQSANENEKLYTTIKGMLSEDHIFHPSVQNCNNIPKLFKGVAIDILAPDKQIPDAKIKGQRLAENSLGDALLSDLRIDLTNETLKEKINAASLENNRTANNQSIVIKLTPLDTNEKKIEKCALLLTGDADKESWDYMINQSKSKLQAQILKLAHHGSRTGTDKNILAKVKPKYCIICCGSNSHGLPDEDVLKMIDEESLEIFCTGRNTTITGEKSGPCKNDILKCCPRWDNKKNEPIKETITFEVDTKTQKTICSAKACSFDWGKIK
jgi:beta-lactamase superfamily II metal-dependent hydrolase